MLPTHSAARVFGLLVVVLAPNLRIATAGSDRPMTLDTDPNLVGWWTFDEAVGDVVPDSSKHGRDGTPKGGLSLAQSLVAGKAGKALQFNGGDACLEVAHYKGVTGTRPRTVAAWIKTASPRGEILSWGTEDFGQMFTFGFIRERIGVTPHGGYLYMNPVTHDDRWHHVAVVVQEAELPNLYDHVTLYLNGEPAEIHDIGLLDLWPIQTGRQRDVRIGRGFTGLIDDLRLYDRALSEGQVQALFKLETNRPLSKAE